MTEDEILNNFHELAVKAIKLHPDMYDAYISDSADLEDIPTKKKRPASQENVFGICKPNESKEERADRLANGYKRIDERKGMCNDITGSYIVKRIFSTSCLKCGESDWRKLGCDRIDNSKGHLMDNVVCACRKCNMLRNTIPFEKFYS